MSDTEKNAGNEHEHSGCFFRAIWTLFGNVVLAILFLFLVKRGKEWTGFDIAYWVVVALLMVVRYLDIKTSPNHPNPIPIMIRYSVLLIIASFALWMIGHAIAWYLLP